MWVRVPPGAHRFRRRADPPPPRPFRRRVDARPGPAR
ncbi:hypothetical protein Ae168Ps1_5419c [Pseudonocardia sp. Ae168_Ps1]|nr:hypothetical protein Ae168Ps1_5419c [Pseudonocardia sp. Ae168_Ps1]